MAYGLFASHKKQWKYQKKNSHLGFCFSSHYENMQSAVKNTKPKKRIWVNLSVEILLPNLTMRLVNKLHLNGECDKEIWWGVCARTHVFVRGEECVHVCMGVPVQK